MYLLRMHVRVKERLNGMVLSAETVENSFKTLKEVRDFIKKQDVLKRVQGIKGKVFSEQKNGKSKVTGFFMRGRRKEEGKTIYEEAWCEVYRTTIIIL